MATASKAIGFSRTSTCAPSPSELQRPPPGPVFIATKSDLAHLVQSSCSAENARLLMANGEDDLDGWEMESPLSSPPSSRASSPDPDHQATSPPQAASKKRKTRRGRRSKEKQRSEYHQRREKEHAQRRKKARTEQDPRDYRPSQYSLAKVAEMEAIPTPGKALNLRVASGGWQGADRSVGRVHPDLEEFLAAGNKVITWDGLSTAALVDENQVVFGALIGRPNDPTWMATADRCLAALADAKEKMEFKGRIDRRGDFKTIAFGLSFGGGSKRPGNLKCSPHNTKVMEELLASADMRRMASLARDTLAVYFPDLSEEYAQVLGRLYDSNPTFRRPFSGCPWPAISINFPPNSYTRIHTDSGNKANGMCPIFSLGSFDHTKGGHLVLPDLKIAIEFPAGAMIMIPSATLRHGNIPVRDGEVRASWTLYAAAGLFRWVELGFKSWETVQKEGGRTLDEEVARRKTRWREAVRKFPTLDSLKSRMSSPAAQPACM